jgi:endonuclease YncB( thermonuclease family)
VVCRILLVLLLVILAGGARADSLEGAARAIDGRTIAVEGERVRLLDLDAPEPEQLCRDAAGQDYACGARATSGLAALLRRGKVDCAWDRRDADGTRLGRCTLAGADLALPLLEQGLALPARDCKCEVYRDAAAVAEAHRLGLWSGAFEMPWDWRAAHPLPIPAP